MRDQQLLPFDRAYFERAAAEAGFPLYGSLAAQFERYYKVLVEYNRKVNLTAVTDPNGVAMTHFVDSLTLLRAELAQGARLCDVGAGAGFPSVPVGLYRPDLSLTLIDSLNKRVTFLAYLSEQLSLPLTALHLRAEEAGRQSALREQFDVVCSRAVARLYLLCEYCLPLLKVGGRLIAMKGPQVRQELDEAERAMHTLGVGSVQVDSFSLPDGSGRSLVILQKTAPTPEKYPRPSAKIAKDPLI